MACTSASSCHGWWNCLCLLHCCSYVGGRVIGEGSAGGYFSFPLRPGILWPTEACGFHHFLECLKLRPLQYLHLGLLFIVLFCFLLLHCLLSRVLPFSLPFHTTEVSHLWWNFVYGREGFKFLSLVLLLSRYRNKRQIIVFRLCFTSYAPSI